MRFNNFYGVSAVFVKHNFDEKLSVTKSGVRTTWLKQLGDCVRRERMDKCLTQQRLAELADLNIRNVQRIEAGEIAVLFSTMVRIKKALGCPWDRLTPGDKSTQD